MLGAVAQYPGLCFTMSAIPTAPYLAARALVSYPACTFRHVFFAGSVVRTSYDWKTLVDAGRVGRVLNIVASRDWVVALLPKSLERFRSFDLGSWLRWFRAGRFKSGCRNRSEN